MMDQVQMGLILILQQMCVSMNVIWPVVMIVLLLSLARVNRKSSRIEVARCKIRSGYGVTIGSEVSAGVSDVYIHDIDFFQSDCGIRMKSSKERGGVIENIRVENLNMIDVQFPFSWIMDWHNEYNRKNSNDLAQMPESWQAVAEEIPESKQMTKVKDIHIKNVQACLSPGY